jgi:succinyl-CoA synthetase alpha subunit
VLEAAEAGIEFIVAITEGVPAHDEAYFYNKLKSEYPNSRLLGPNCPGIISPGKTNIGITAGHIAKEGGPVGIVSRSGTLTYQALYELKQNKMTKPVSSYIAGVTAPPGKKMGHAGAIVSGGKGTAQAKMEALTDAGVRVGNNPTEAGELMAEIVAAL